MSSAERVRDSIVQGVGDLGFGAHGLHVQVGSDAAEYRWTADEREDVQSVAKAVCVLAAGIAADDGLIDFDAPIAGYLSGSRAGSLAGVELGDGVEVVTLRHLLTMTSGIDLPWSESMMSDWPDLAREFLQRPSRGRVFQYSNASTYTAMRVLATKVSDVAEFVAEHLFAPLGIFDVEWERCPNGLIVAGGGLFLSTAELARVARLIRDRGELGGRCLVSPSWIDGMHTGWVAAGEHPGYDRYALAGWGGPGQAWRIHGAYGQMMIFLGDAVVTITASDHFGADAMAQRIVEALEAELTAKGKNPSCSRKVRADPPRRNGALA